MYNNFDYTTSSILLFLFCEYKKKPDVVVKLCQKKYIIEKEFDNLVAINNSLPGLSPVPLFRENFDEFGVLGMKSVSGKSIVSWQERIASLPEIVDRLIKFHHCMQNGVLDQAQLSERFQKINKLCEELTLSRECVENLITANATLKQYFLPEIPQHCDLCFNNILKDNASIFFLDWEDFGNVSMPAYDLFCLISSFCFSGQSESVNRFFKDTVLVENIRQCIRKYFDAFGLSLNAAYELFIYTLFEQLTLSHNQGRTSKELFLKRLVKFTKHSQCFRQLLRGL